MTLLNRLPWGISMAMSARRRSAISERSPTPRAMAMRFFAAEKVYGNRDVRALGLFKQKGGARGFHHGIGKRGDLEMGIHLVGDAF